MQRIASVPRVREASKAVEQRQQAAVVQDVRRDSLDVDQQWHGQQPDRCQSRSVWDALIGFEASGLHLSRERCW